MNPERATDIANDFLGMLERREMALLSWGLVDGSFSEVELEGGRALLRTALGGDFASADEAIELAEEGPAIPGSPGNRGTTEAALPRRFAFLAIAAGSPRHGRRWRRLSCIDARFLTRFTHLPRRQLKPKMSHFPPRLPPLRSS